MSGVMPAVTPTPPTVVAAYQYCAKLTRSHYENFPVASILLPRRLRLPISVIYAYARTADDLADEGPADVPTRLAALDTYRAQLDRLCAASSTDQSANPWDHHPIFIALADVIVRYQLPYAPFYDLLSAFRQDVTQRRYGNEAELLDYCRRSANPVGHLLLHLYNRATPQNLAWSDAICTALQIINFLQDLAQDYEENDRIYLPQDAMTAYGVSEEHLRTRCNDSAMRALIDAQITRTRARLLSGAPLCGKLPGRAGLELRFTVWGGVYVLDALSRRLEVYARPRLRRRDWLMMAMRALWGRTPQ